MVRIGAREDIRQQGRCNFLGASPGERKKGPKKVRSRRQCLPKEGRRLSEEMTCEVVRGLRGYLLQVAWW